MKKDFNGWNTRKQSIDTIQKIPFFNEREIWWCSIGVNIGYEIFGKGQNFTRPVLIIKKYSSASFLGVPLTSKLKDKSNYYFPLECAGKQSIALLGQFRVFDARRLCDKIERVGKHTHEEIKHFIKQSI